MIRIREIQTFYHPKMVPDDLPEGNYSQSPVKPGLLLEFLEKKGLMEHFRINDDFEPFGKEDFYIAHRREYVDRFFDEGKVSALLRVKATPGYIDSVRYTNASLYHAIKTAVEQPQQVTLSPTSGFHHATPRGGALFCAFSGQVIASARIYREKGLSGAYIDLDGHFGNSIENSRSFVPDLDKAIPADIGNINIESQHGQYLKDLEVSLKSLEKAVLEDRVHYLVFCHGADSHEWDDQGYQLTTEEWLQCSELFYDFVARLDKKRDRPTPLALALFGGYRKDDFDAVLGLHTADLVRCLNRVCGHSIAFRTV